MVGAFNVRLTNPARETDMVGLLNHDAHSADAAMDDDAPSRRISVGATDSGLVTIHSADREPFGQHDDRQRADLPACSLAEMGATSPALALAQLDCD